MPGFNAPGILFIGAWGAADRQFLVALMTKLRPRYNRAIEPCAGAFAMSAVYRHAGFKPEQIQASDVSLFTSALGCLFSDRPVEQLCVTLDGEPLEPTGDPLVDVASILFLQAMLRLEAKPDVHHWREHRRDLEERKQAHLERIMRSLEQMDAQLHGLAYTPLDMVDHIRSVQHDPETIIFIAPPTYTKGYERFFDTKGRLEWAEPRYGVWDPTVDHARLAGEAEGMEATLISLQMTAETGKCHHNEPLYARHERKGITTYIWTNKPGVVLPLLGMTAIPKALPDPEPIEGARILPHNHKLTAKSTVSVQALNGRNVRYYKDLWLHRITPKDATWDFGVFIDGFLVGIAGYDSAMMDYRGGGTWNMWGDALLLFYSVGVPGHELRTTRLIMEIALSREVVDTIVPAWQAVRANRLMTLNLTRYPEAKGNRGIFKLVERKKDKEHGFKLTYAAELKRVGPQDAYRRWLQKEQQRVAREATT